MAEAIGIVSGVASLADQLLKASLKGYEILKRTQSVGTAYNDFELKVEIEKVRLVTWSDYWITDNARRLARRLEETGGAPQLAVAMLARIAAVFNDIETFKARYGLELLPQQASSSELRLATPEKKRSFRNSWKKFRARSPAPEPTIDEDSIKLLDALPSELGQRISDVEKETLKQRISDIKKATLVLQSKLPAWDKICWAVTEREKALGLVQQLKEYNEALHNLLPLPVENRTVDTGPSAAATAAAMAASVGFDVPLSLPYKRNRNFYGRQDVLQEIHDALETETARGVQAVVVLDGLGGIGKSQIALEYAYHHHRDLGSFTAVFWIDATNTTTLNKSAEDIAGQLVMHYKTSMVYGMAEEKYSAIASQLHLEGWIDKTTGKLNSAGDDLSQILYALKRWFTRLGNDRFLLVVDNWDDTDIDAKVLLPDCGKVIITSRRLFPGSVCITISPIDHDAGLALLKASAGKPNLTDSERESGIRLAERLGYLPLALHQAGAYVGKNNTFAKYHDLLDENIKILESKRRTSTQQLQAYRPDTVFATWEISFQRLSQPAQELLLLCGFVSNQDIPDELFERACRQETTKEFMPWMDGNDWLQEALDDVFSFSLAARMDADESFSIHPLVHDWACARLDDATKRRKTAEAVVLLGCIYQDVNEKSTQDWIFERRIYPHLSLCCQNIQRYSPQEHATETQYMYLAAAYNLGCIFDGHGKYDEALEWYQRALAGCEKAVGEHVSTLDTVHCMAIVFDKQGRYDEALEWYQRALAGCEKALGKEHVSTLETVHCMACVFSNQGRYDEALEWYQRALAGREKALGKEHVSTLGTVHKMASVFYNQGRYDEALEWYQRALAGREKALGKEHVSTLHTVHNMAVVFENQGRYDEALEWYQRALAGSEKALGKEHVSTLDTVHSMATVFENQGRYDEALEWYQRALAGREKALGDKHLQTQRTIKNLIDVCETVGRLESAAQLRQRLA